MRFTMDDIKNSAVAGINPHLFEQPKEKKRKYGNKKVIVDGLTFDSKKEANRYFELKTLKAAGHIYNLFTQVVFELSVCKYIADFSYQLSATDQLVVEDVKSPATRKLSTYRLKKKLMLAEKGITIKEV